MDRAIQHYIELTNQLIIHLKRIPSESYSENLSIFDGSTIGEHIRHIYNFPECLLLAIQTGIVNYDKRTRNKEIENNRDYAIKALQEQLRLILELTLSEDLLLNLESISNENKIKTNLNRELHYIIEHTTHHMAILRLGIKFHFPKIKIDESFGFAKSTLEYENNLISLQINLK